MKVKGSVDTACAFARSIRYLAKNLDAAITYYPSQNLSFTMSFEMILIC